MIGKGGGGEIGRLIIIASSAGDDGERLFALNLACAHRQAGEDVLLVDCVPPSSEAAQHVSRLSLAYAVSHRHGFDREWIILPESECAVPDVPVIDGGAAPEGIANAELLEFLSIVLGLYGTVILSLGALSETRLFTELLPISALVHVLTTQEREAIRAAHTLLLQADPARRWRKRVTLVVDRHDSSVAPTAAQIGDTIGVSRFAILPVATPSEQGSTEGSLPSVLRHPDSPYSTAIFKVAAIADAPRPPTGTESAPPPGKNKVTRGRTTARGATRMSVGLTFAYCAVALPCLLGTSLLFLFGTELGAVSPADVAWSSLVFDALFLVASTSFIYMILRRYFHQGAGMFEQLKALTEHSLAGIAFTDEAGIIRYTNPVFRRLLNLSHATTEDMRLDAVLASRMGGKDPRELLTSVGEGHVTIRSRSGGQQELDLTLSARRVRLVNADIGWVVNVQDVTAGRALRESSAISTSALEVAADGILVVDLAKPNFPLIYVNKAFEEITGYSRREVIGKNARFLQGNDRMQPEIAAMSRAIRQCTSLTVTLRNYRKDGTLFWNQMRLAPVVDQHGRSTHYVAIQRDVTAQRQAADQMEQLAYLDALTGLPNRTRFKRQLTDLLAGDGGQQIIVARIDVQHLHEVNTSAGYERGDTLLLEVRTRLRAMFPAGLVGRLTGDEFVVAYRHDPEQPDDATLGALRDRLAQAYELPGMRLHVTFAMGYTLADGLSAEIALRQAAVAVHEAKTAGIAEIRRFDPATEALIRTRARLTAEMQQSLGTDDFQLHYQPKVDLATGALIGAEALVRWQHPVFGLQRPDRFIGLAEQTGLIVELGGIVFAKAATMAAAVNGPGRPIIPISVNVSLFQFRQAGLQESFEQALADVGAEASWITLELTESVFVGTSFDLIARLHALRARGFGLSLDDFGTGYASLRYLQNFPLTEIKLDRCFISNLDQNTYNHAITEAVLTIGNDLGVQVIAEGIETEAEHRALRRLKCHGGQGFLFSEPLSADGFLKLGNDPRQLPWSKAFGTAARGGRGNKVLHTQPTPK